ncbi:DUF1800 domain-containing protein [Sphingomonas sp. ASY06-1R]|uniref:DUF1800 domain-containing protein n=1 Tax=Sphingomonas sp. ASY06-1R TaxID=3445771 RepID=UPI003FA1C15A
MGRNPGLNVKSAMVLAVLITPMGVEAKKPSDFAWANRLTWGVSAQPVVGPQPGSRAWLDAQLSPHPDDTLPPAIAAQIAAMEISRKSMQELLVENDALTQAAKKLTDVTQRDAARKVYNQLLNDHAAEAATRSLLRDVYAPDQLREQLTWFWLNHFSVLSVKGDIRATIGDYEDTLRSHSLGKFRTLLEATLKHPAMLRFLDNDHNAVKRINENYAREIMELHTMGVGSGYTQNDVQELARILTGVGVNIYNTPPKLRPEHCAQYLREGVFEFNPDRHDFGDKTFLGHSIKGSGFGEVEEALDLIADAPATAHYVSEKLATYFMGDNPPAALVDQMTAAWRRSDGDISTVLRTMIRAPAFEKSLGSAFKDPMHFAVSAMRATYGDRTIVNMKPASAWLSRMGEALYARPTPDGYPMNMASWTGPGQMAVRFEIARQIGFGNSGLLSIPLPSPPIVRLVPEPAAAVAGGALPRLVALPLGAPATPLPATSVPPAPLLKGSATYASIAPSLSAATVSALAQATTPQQWNALFLSSPEFMRR